MSGDLVNRLIRETKGNYSPEVNKINQSGLTLNRSEYIFQIMGSLSAVQKLSDILINIYIYILIYKKYLFTTCSNAWIFFIYTAYS